jgi:hypothetical protein
VPPPPSPDGGEAPPVEGGEGEGAPTSKRQDPAYARWFKLKSIGVPLQALIPKMLEEGLDPDVLKDEEYLCESKSPTFVGSRPTAVLSSMSRDVEFGPIGRRRRRSLREPFCPGAEKVYPVRHSN